MILNIDNYDHIYCVHVYANFLVATATDQQNKQYSITMLFDNVSNVYYGSHQQLQVFKHYKSTAIRYIYSFLKYIYYKTN